MPVQQTTIRRRGRPPKDLAGFNETRESLLRSGVEILTEKGFSSTGIDEILRRVNVPKGSFYHYFKNKDDFGKALINSYDNYFSNKLDHFLLDDLMTPLQRIEAFVADAEAGMARYHFKRGCLAGNLGQEMGSLAETFRNQLQQVFQGWQLKLEACLTEAQKTGQITKQIDCKKFSYVFWIGWEGAVLRSKLDQNPDALKAFTEFYFLALKA